MRNTVYVAFFGVTKTYLRVRMAATRILRAERTCCWEKKEWIYRGSKSLMLARREFELKPPGRSWLAEEERLRKEMLAPKLDKSRTLGARYLAEVRPKKPVDYFFITGSVPDNLSTSTCWRRTLSSTIFT